jgi:MYXO-CTERM domain-containing protein
MLLALIGAIVVAFSPAPVAAKAIFCPPESGCLFLSFEATSEGSVISTPGGLVGHTTFTALSKDFDLHLKCVDCAFDFTIPSHPPGGSMSLTGSLFTDAGVLLGSGTLLSGTWDSVDVYGDSLSAVGIAALDPTLKLPGTGEWFFGLTFDSAGDIVSVDGLDHIYAFHPTDVPTPPGIALMLAGLMAIGALRRRA